MFSEHVWLRKIGFFGTLILMVVFLISNIFGFEQKQALVRRTGAIVVAPAVTVKSTPARQGTDLFILHEGTKVDIIDDGMQEWKEIRIADGKQGWVENKQIEMI